MWLQGLSAASHATEARQAGLLGKVFVQLLAQVREAAPGRLAVEPELGHIHAGLPILESRNVLLRHPQPLGKIGLQEPFIDPESAQALQEAPVLRREP